MLLSLSATILIHPAQYLDPGTGSVILQLALAAFLGIGVATRVFWKQIKTLFGKGKPDVIDTDDEDDN